MAGTQRLLAQAQWRKYVAAIGCYVERMLVKLGTLRHPADADISAPMTLALSCPCLPLNVALNSLDGLLVKLVANQTAKHQHQCSNAVIFLPFDLAA